MNPFAWDNGAWIHLQNPNLKAVQQWRIRMDTQNECSVKHSHSVNAFPRFSWSLCSFNKSAPLELHCLSKVNELPKESLLQWKLHRWVIYGTLKLVCRIQICCPIQKWCLPLFWIQSVIMLNIRYSNSLNTCPIWRTIPNLNYNKNVRNIHYPEVYPETAVDGI